MLTLNDGRSELWQWDTGRTLDVDADCSQVHFSNKVFGRSIDVDVVDGMAIIPDILLQTDKELTAWAFVGTAENGYTKISKAFKVNKRNKPADYVFTPPEQTTLAEIVERIDDLESTQDPDAIKNAVDDYLANNPIKVEETDPTVPDWAKQPDPPDLKIPDKLPNPHSLTFTGAVNTSYDGSAPVEIKIPDSGGNANQGTGWTTEQINLLDELFNYVHFNSAEGGTIADNLIASLRGEAVKTLVSISATYSGGEVEEGTALTALTGIVVTATYDDGSTATVYGYTLSGTIAEGENTITVTYGGKTATFTVTGTASSGGEEEPDVTTYTVTNNLTNVTSSNSTSTVEQGSSYSAILSANNGYDIDSVTVTMGGVDVTSTVYLDGTINIVTVCGDIVITATAKAEPVIVPMGNRYNDRTNTTIYSDDGTEMLEDNKTSTMMISEEIFTADTEVTVTIITNGVMYSKMYGACYDSGFDITAKERSLYHAELLFDAWTDVGKEGTYTKTYTVKAGYGLAIVNPAATVAPVTSVTVTK